MKYEIAYPAFNSGQLVKVESFDDDMIYDASDRPIEGAIPVEECDRLANVYFGKGLSDDQIRQRHQRAPEICVDFILRLVHLLRDIGGLWLDEYALLEGEGMVVVHSRPELRARWLEAHKDDCFDW